MITAAIAVLANQAMAMTSTRKPGEECRQYNMAVMSELDLQETIPELIRIVSGPFEPVRLGVDSDDLIASKLVDIDCRAKAVDILGEIGPPAALSAGMLIDWAVQTRVIPAAMPTVLDDQMFVDFITIDILERMRVAGSVTRFGAAAAGAIAASLKSPDEERRKLAVAILSEKVLPIANVLLNSGECGDRRLGTEILTHMWPVVSRKLLTVLRDTPVCDAGLTKR
jgi:hypothetical protein